MSTNESPMDKYFESRGIDPEQILAKHLSVIRAAIARKRRLRLIAAWSAVACWITSLACFGLSVAWNLRPARPFPNRLLG